MSGVRVHHRDASHLVSYQEARQRDNVAAGAVLSGSVAVPSVDTTDTGGYCRGSGFGSLFETVDREMRMRCPRTRGEPLNHPVGNKVLSDNGSDISAVRSSASLAEGAAHTDRYGGTDDNRHEIPNDGWRRHDIGEVSRRSLREHVGSVSQDPFRFDGTVEGNVAYATSGRAGEN
jgi:hypothetical protein